MSIIESLRTYILTYPNLVSGAEFSTDYLGAQPVGYAIIPMPGDKIIEKYLDGGSLREFPFAFNSAESTAAELERLENIGFFETFADWLESQTAAGTLPSLGTKKTATEIKAENWGYLYREGSSETGVYQIICKLIYEQQP